MAWRHSSAPARLGEWRRRRRPFWQPLVVPRCITPHGPPTADWASDGLPNHRPPKQAVRLFGPWNSTRKLGHGADRRDQISLPGQTNRCGPCCLMGRHAIWFELMPQWARCVSLGCKVLSGPPVGQAGQGQSDQTVGPHQA
jgi:hypothetical protein